MASRSKEPIEGLSQDFSAIRYHSSNISLLKLAIGQVRLKAGRYESSADSGHTALPLRQRIGRKRMERGLAQASGRYEIYSIYNLKL